MGLLMLKDEEVVISGKMVRILFGVIGWKARCCVEGICCCSRQAKRVRWTREAQSAQSRGHLEVG